MGKRLLIFICVHLMLITGCSKEEPNKSTTTIPGKTQQPSANVSSSGSAESQKKLIQPEQLISKEDATLIIGESVKDGVKDQHPKLGMNICFYAAENADSKSYLQIALIQKESMSSGQSGGSDKSGDGSDEQSGQSGGQSDGQSGGQSGGGGEMAPKDLYEGFKKLFSDPNIAVTGRIGDDTFITSQGMNILSGEYYICVNAGGFNPQKTQAVLKQAGELAVYNLKRIQGE